MSEDTGRQERVYFALVALMTYLYFQGNWWFVRVRHAVDYWLQLLA
ncbi:hypothetical protein [Halorhabdus sp. CUG00001]|nr:hypothetical protein [Halorhabdus sp. CUG00001]